MRFTDVQMTQGRGVVILPEAEEGNQWSRVGISISRRSSAGDTPSLFADFRNRT